MSFRTRVLLLVVLVAAAATMATAWFTFRLAAAQSGADQATDQQVVAQVSGTLVDYAQQRGGWTDLGTVLARLAAATGKHIHVTTEGGTTLGSARDGATSYAGPPLVTRVDPHPRLHFNDEDAETATAVAYLELDAYRTGSRLASCLAADGIAVVLLPGRNGVPHAAPPVSAEPGLENTTRRCRSAAVSTNAERDSDFAAVNACTASAAAAGAGTGARSSCLQAAFTNQIRAVGPAPVLVAIDPVVGNSGLPVAPLIGLVTLVVAGAVLGSAVVGRRTVRPVAALTRAARRLGAGEAWEPVTVQGTDEVAELTRTFNAMAAALKRGEERQRQLVADVAHELRTPMSTVRSYLEGLIDGVVPAGPELFVSLHDEALLQQRIVEDLQDLAQAEAGTLTYRRSRWLVPELLETCRIAVAVQAEYAGIRLAVQATDPAEVYADADRIRQVIGNLVGNALRYTPPDGQLTLCCTVAGPMAVIEVTDTGCGIAAVDLPKVFDRFWRADASRVRTTGGSGLGLAIAKQIVTDHGGDMAVRSRVGHGTTFTVRLPLATP